MVMRLSSKEDSEKITWVRFPPFAPLIIMNIFSVNKDPVFSARQLCNKHVIKMPTESMQMLHTAFEKNKFKLFNPQHPCSVWARQSKDNFNWLIEHGLALCDEYKNRYLRKHKAQESIEWVRDNQNQLDFAESKLTPFPRCFSEFKAELDKTIEDTHLAYQEFYNLDKTWAQWHSLEKIPAWWRGNLEKSVDKSFVMGKYIKRQKNKNE